MRGGTKKVYEVGFFAIPNHSSVIERFIKISIIRQVSPYKGYLERYY